MSSFTNFPMSASSIPAFSIIPSSVQCTPVPLPSSPSTSTSLPTPTSPTDRDILSYILDPTLQYTALVPSPTPTPPPTLPPTTPSIPPSTLTLLTKLQSQAISAADEERFDDALSLFSQLLSLSPNYPPALNNRAQVYLLLHRPADALNDLNAAIAHASDPLTLRQAHTQRGLIHRREGREEEAKADFTIAAGLGGRVAKQQLVAMNPYSALCNAMLSRAMQELQGGSVVEAGSDGGSGCNAEVYHPHEE